MIYNKSRHKKIDQYGTYTINIVTYLKIIVIFLEVRQFKAIKRKQHCSATHNKTQFTVSK